MDKTIRVSILGRTYPLRVEEGDEEFTRRVASVVDARAREMQRLAEGHPDLTHVVLAAMSLGEEALAAQDRSDTLQQMAADADALADRLDTALMGPTGDGASGAPAQPKDDAHDEASSTNDPAGPDANPGASAVVVPPTETDSEEEHAAGKEPVKRRQRGAKKGSGPASNNPKTP